MRSQSQMRYYQDQADGVIVEELGINDKCIVYTMNSIILIISIIYTFTPFHI
jgi:hypothetical protein